MTGQSSEGSQTSEPRLPGQVALVTGGGRGIGRVISEAMAREGAKVAVLGQAPGPLEETVKAIEAAGGMAIAVRASVAEPDEMKRAIAEAEAALGPLTVLVNNAGIGGASGPFWQCDPEEWWNVVEVNLRGPFLGTRFVLPGMVERGQGRIINMGSYVGIYPNGQASPYATSKAALMRLTDTVAEGVEDKGVAVFCISPGYVRTDMTRELEERRKKEDPDFEPMPDEWVFPAEMAGELCVRLATGVADKLTGRMIHVRDDLDAMIAEADRIIAEDRYALRLTVDLD